MKLKLKTIIIIIIIIKCGLHCGGCLIALPHRGPAPEVIVLFLLRRLVLINIQLAGSAACLSCMCVYASDIHTSVDVVMCTRVTFLCVHMCVVIHNDYYSFQSII